MAKSVESQNLKARIRRERRRSLLGGLLKLLVILALSALTAYMFFSSVIVQESSMSPTLEAGDQVFINRMAYAMTGVHRGDIIAYRSSSSIDSGVHVKRVIGLPGERVKISDGLITIDGTTYIETQAYPNITNAGIAENGVSLGSEEYFVLGDNRNNSEDSRFADVGNIKRDEIIGKVWFRSQPYSEIGFVR